jgi:hypothetical protein
VVQNSGGLRAIEGTPKNAKSYHVMTPNFSASLLNVRGDLSYNTILSVSTFVVE